MERQTTGLLLCVDFRIQELNTGAQNDKRRGSNEKFNYYRKFFQTYGGPKSGKNTTNRNNQIIYFASCFASAHPLPLFIFYSAACSLLPHSYFAVGEIKDGEAGGWLYPPPSSFICEVLLERVI